MRHQDQCIAQQEDGGRVQNDVIVGLAKDLHQLGQFFTQNQFRRVGRDGASGNYIEVGLGTGLDHLLHFATPHEVGAHADVVCQTEVFVDFRLVHVEIQNDRFLSCLRQNRRQVCTDKRFSFLWVQRADQK